MTPQAFTIGRGKGVIVGLLGLLPVVVGGLPSSWGLGGLVHLACVVCNLSTNTSHQTDQMCGREDPEGLWLRRSIFRPKPKARKQGLQRTKLPSIPRADDEGQERATTTDGEEGVG